MSKRVVEDLFQVEAKVVSTQPEDLFSSDVSIPDDGTLRIRIAGTLTFTATLKITGSSAKSRLLNSGAAIPANSWFGFEVPVSRGDTVNINVDVNTTYDALLQLIRTF